MALRGCAAFPKKVNAAPPGTFIKFDVRHGSKPWTLAAMLTTSNVKRRYIITLTIVIVLLAGLFALRTYNRWHYKKYEVNVVKNHDIMKYFVRDNEEYIRIAFNRLESEFKSPNDFQLDAFSIRKLDTSFDGTQDTIYNVYFTYYLANDNKNKRFSKVSVLASVPTLQLHNLGLGSNSEYLKIKEEKEQVERETMRSLKESFQQLPDSTRKAIRDTIKKALE
jgi:hypothetical protein